jgi:hypothetical protein
MSNNNLIRIQKIIEVRELDDFSAKGLAKHYTGRLLNTIVKSFSHAILNVVAGRLLSFALDRPINTRNEVGKNLANAAIFLRKGNNVFDDGSSLKRKFYRDFVNNEINRITKGKKVSGYEYSRYLKDMDLKQNAVLRDKFNDAWRVYLKSYTEHAELGDATYADIMRSVGFDKEVYGMAEDLTRDLFYYSPYRPSELFNMSYGEFKKAFRKKYIGSKEGAKGMSILWREMSLEEKEIEIEEAAKRYYKILKEFEKTHPYQVRTLSLATELPYHEYEGVAESVNGVKFAWDKLKKPEIYSGPTKISPTEWRIVVGNGVQYYARYEKSITGVLIISFYLRNKEEQKIFKGSYNFTTGEIIDVRK